jgi:hypothetical protein
LHFTYEYIKKTIYKHINAYKKIILVLFIEYYALQLIIEFSLSENGKYVKKFRNGINSMGAFKRKFNLKAPSI